MQLVHTNTSVSTNVDNKVQFGISKNSAKLFSMLSTSLYSNKERAVLYEIGANCSDAHVLNGNQAKPWQLTLPTRIDSHIKFRDYGPGLDEKDVYCLLTTYGESTKAHSNDFIGAYGIGSKSPAAVSSTWNVISYFGGMMKEYMVFVDQSGVPSLTKLREEASNETGLEVIIPVQPNRISAWTDSVHTVFKHYAVKPKVINYHHNWVTQTPIQEGTNWKMYPHNGYSANLAFIVTQREYVVDKDTLKNEFRGEAFLKLLDYNLNVVFSTGELETSLSREQLQYTRHTLDAIKSVLTKVHSEIKANILAIVDVAKDGLEYRQLIGTASEKIFGNRSATRQILDFVVGNKYNVSSQKDLETFVVKVKNIKNKTFKVFDGKSRISTMNTQFTCFKMFAVTMDHEINTSDGQIDIKISYLDKFKVVINDDKKTAARVRHSGKGFVSLVINESDKKVLPSELHRFIVKATAYDLPPKAPKGTRKNKVKTADVWRMNRNSFIRIDETMVNKNKDVVVVEFENAKQQSSMPVQHQKLYDLMKYKGYEFIGVKKGAKIPSYATPIEKFATNEIKKMNVESFVDTYYYTCLRDTINSCWENGVRTLSRSQYRTPNASIWNELKDILDDIKTRTTKATVGRDKFEYLESLCKEMGVPLKTSSAKAPTLDFIKDMLYNTYGMLQFVDQNVGINSLKKYLEQVGE
jgi:hypothetical protein